MQLNVIHTGQALNILKTLPDNSIHCIVTSPPYWGLRDYNVKGQIGLEKTPTEFINALLPVFQECYRVLRKDGTMWVNIGDSYASSGKKRTIEQAVRNSTLTGSTVSQEQILVQQNKICEGLKAKDLVGIPWMLAFSLRNEGWYLRQDIIWHKPNPMPESVSDRCTKSHEYLFLFSKSTKYYFDQEAIRVPLADESIARLSQDIENQKVSERVPGKNNGNMKAVVKGYPIGDSKGTANKRSVWTVTTKPFKEAHFATFPPDLIIDCIKASSIEGGIVLDPFMGSGTTAIVARKLGRNYIGIDINPEYIKIAERRLKKELGLFQ